MHRQPPDGARPQRAALYVRVSTARQVDGNSLTTQKAQLKRYAVTHGYEVVDVYIDAGYSGRNTKRPQLQRLLEDVHANLVDIVLVTRVDRISRSMKDLLDLMDTLRDEEVAFTAVEQPFDTSDPSGVLAQSILGSFAQFERELLIERTRDGQLHRLRRTDWSCGPVPFGYRKEAGKLFEVPDDAAIVRRVFDLFIELKSRRGVAVRFNEEHVKAPGGKMWSDNTVTCILRNPVYTGANVYGRHRKGDTRLRPREEWTVLPGMRKPLVAPEVFQRAQDVLEETRPRGIRPRSTLEHPLSSVARCTKCGSPMHVSTSRPRGKVYRYYKCSLNRRGGSAACSGTSIPAEQLEAMVSATPREAARDRRTETNSKGRVDDSAKASHERRKALDAVTHEIAAAFQAYENREMEKDVFQKRMARLTAKRRKLVSAVEAPSAA